MPDMHMPDDKFAMAARLCAEAYAEQCVVAEGEDIADARERQRLTREARGATAFEELYCTLRDIADDWHRESIRRRDGKEKGMFTAEYCNPGMAIELTFGVALKSVKDWDY